MLFLPKKKQEIEKKTRLSSIVKRAESAPYLHHKMKKNFLFEGIELGTN